MPVAPDRGVTRRCRRTRIAVLVAFLILASASAAVSALSAGGPVPVGTWRYEGLRGSQGSTLAHIQFYSTLMGPLSGGRTDVRFGGIAGTMLGRCSGGVYRNGNLMDFYVLNARIPVWANGKFSISKRHSNGSLGPGTVKIVGAFVGANGSRWTATIELSQHQIGHGTCTATRAFQAKRRERTG
jgi:hypothetical protein